MLYYACRITDQHQTYDPISQRVSCLTNGFTSKWTFIKYIDWCNHLWCCFCFYINHIDFWYYWNCNWWRWNNREHSQELMLIKLWHLTHTFIHIILLERKNWYLPYTTTWGTRLTTCWSFLCKLACCDNLSWGWGWRGNWNKWSVWKRNITPHGKQWPAVLILLPHLDEATILSQRRAVAKRDGWVTWQWWIPLWNRLKIGKILCTFVRRKVPAHASTMMRPMQMSLTISNSQKKILIIFE